MKMKNKIIPIAIIILIVILVGIWLYPSSDSENKEGDELTGAGISEENTEVETKELINKEDTQVDEISGKDLIDKCLITCASEAKTSLEIDIWKSVCNKKYKQGEDVIREFIKTC